MCPWIACPPVFWNWRLATFSTEACPIACHCARCPAAPAAAAASQFAAVTRDDAFLLFEVVFLGAPFLSFMATILRTSSPARYAPSSPPGAPGTERVWVKPGGCSGTLSATGARTERCGSAALGVVFQLAHCVEEAEFPLPRPDTGRIEHAWAIHQAQTTVNFARRSGVAAWLLGGLNFQIEHHLFPRICHVNYPAMAQVVEDTCHEFGVRYREHPSVRAGLASHVRWLQRMGRPSPIS